MYDDPSFYALQQAQTPRVLEPHTKKGALLEPQDSQANPALGESPIPETVVEGWRGPPAATLSRRAQSYTDFHHAARAVLRRSGPESNDTALPLSKSRYLEDAVAREGGGDSFEEWYDDLEGQLLDASQLEYNNFVEEMQFSESYLSGLSSSTSKALNDLAALSESFRDVETQTSIVQTQCQELVTEQRRLEALADDIKDNLQYYSYLEPITRRLNAPTAGRFARGKEFSDMLARLDECLEYMSSHAQHKESATYRSRYRLLMTRGLTLIKVNFTASLQEISQDVAKRIQDKQLNETTMSTLLYAKFRVGASELKEVAQEIQARTILPPGAEPGTESEYQGLMNELYQSYASTRGRLIIPIIQRKIAEFAADPNTADNLVTFARSSIVYIKSMCQDEWDLWREWFSGPAGIYDYLDQVVEPLFDYLRPKIIHETQLVRLCELCTLLQTRYFRDEDDEAETIDPHRFDFAPLIQPALEDAQTRLVFRALAVLRDDVERYRPKNEDLDYPARLKAPLSGRKGAGPVTSGRKNSITDEMMTEPVLLEDLGVANGGYVFGAETSMQGWFPTLRKCIWLLSRIYRLVNSTVFDDLAHNIVHQTTLSLQRAATAIASKSSPADSHLFLLKHLLLLKQQIVAFDIEFVTPDISVDFSGVTSTFYELRQRGSLLDPRAIWSSLAKGSTLLPRVVENMLDAKSELDAALRAVISDLVANISRKVSSNLDKQPGAPTDGKKPTGTAFDAGAAVKQSCEIAEKEIPLFRSKLEEYISDARTKETLVYAVQEQVLQDYENFYERWSSERRARGGTVSTKGKGKEGDVWDIGSFADHMAHVFGVRTAVLEGEDMHEERGRRLSGGSAEVDFGNGNGMHGDADSISSV